MVNNTEFSMSVISKSIKYKTSNIVESGKEIEWYPILQFATFTTSEFTMGLQKDCIWVLEAKNGLYVLDNPDKFWRLVSLLEQPPNEIKKRIKAFFDNLNVAINPDDFFPFIEIIQAGFQFGSKYWAELAFNWYDEILPEKKVYFKEMLEKIEHAKWASQKLRHRAKKELKLLRRSGFLLVQELECGCSERYEAEISSDKLFQEIKNFFDSQVDKEIYYDIPVEIPYFIGYSNNGDILKFFSDKWYKCKICSCLWEFTYPNLPAHGFVRKFPDGVYRMR